MDDPGEPGGPVGVLGCDLVEELGHDERLVRELRDHSPAGRQIAALGERDHPLDPAADLLGLRLGGLDPLVAEDRDGQVLVEGQARPLLAAELPAADSMGHGSGLLRGQVVELLLVFDFFHVVAERAVLASPAG